MPHWFDCVFHRPPRRGRRAPAASASAACGAPGGDHGALQNGSAQLSFQADVRCGAQWRDVAPPRVDHNVLSLLRMDVQSAEPRTVSGSRMRPLARDLRWCGLHTVLPSAGEKPDLASLGREFAKDHTFIHYDERGAVFRIGQCRRSRSIRSFAIWKRLSTRLSRSVRASLGSRKVARPRLPMRRVTRASVSLVLYGAFAQGWRTRGIERIPGRDAPGR